MGDGLGVFAFFGDCLGVFFAANGDSAALTLGRLGVEAGEDEARLFLLWAFLGDFDLFGESGVFLGETR